MICFVSDSGFGCCLFVSVSHYLTTTFHWVFLIIVSKIFYYYLIIYLYIY